MTCVFIVDGPAPNTDGPTTVAGGPARNTEGPVTGMMKQDH